MLRRSRAENACKYEDLPASLITRYDRPKTGPSMAGVPRHDCLYIDGVLSPQAIAVTELFLSVQKSIQ